MMHRVLGYYIQVIAHLMLVVIIYEICRGWTISTNLIGGRRKELFLGTERAQKRRCAGWQGGWGGGGVTYQR